MLLGAFLMGKWLPAANEIHRMGIEITLRCGLHCPQCDHHCDHPELSWITDSDMTLAQIDYFLKEMHDTDTRIVRLTLTGGDLLLHPNVVEIARRVQQILVNSGRLYRHRLRVIVNGLVDPPKELNCYCGAKTLLPVLKRAEKHFAMHSAPCDTGQRLRRHCSGAACNIPYRCGFVLNKYGYYPCGPGGAIIRLFGLSRWCRYELPIKPWETWDLRKLRAEVCSLCQYGAKYSKIQAEYPKPSQSFARALASPAPCPRIYGEEA